MSIGTDRRLAHITWQGRQFDVDIQDLDLGEDSTDAQAKVAIATHLDVPVEKLREYNVVREPGGNLTMRPQAVFGM